MQAPFLGAEIIFYRYKTNILQNNHIADIKSYPHKFSNKLTTPPSIPAKFFSNP